MANSWPYISSAHERISEAAEFPTKHGIFQMRVVEAEGREHAIVYKGQMAGRVISDQFGLGADLLSPERGHHNNSRNVVQLKVPSHDRACLQAVHTRHIDVGKD